jgi:hypothetical protein
MFSTPFWHFLKNLHLEDIFSLLRFIDIPNRIYSKYLEKNRVMSLIKGGIFTTDCEIAIASLHVKFIFSI